MHLFGLNMPVVVYSIFWDDLGKIDFRSKMVTFEGLGIPKWRFWGLLGLLYKGGGLHEDPTARISVRTRRRLLGDGISDKTSSRRARMALTGP